MDLLNASNDSDESDEDYVPDQKEQDKDSESEGDISDDECSPKSRKRLKLDKTVEKAEVNPEEKKKKDDDIWADFMKDTGFKSKNDLSQSKTTKELDKKMDNVVTKTITKEVPNKIQTSVNKNITESKFDTSPTITKTAKGSSSGLSSVLSSLGKKSKFSALEKSKMDWDNFKKEENLEEELQTHNRGKNGYLERQDFLNRADLRRFEIEKSLRTVERNKRDMGI